MQKHPLIAKFVTNTFSRFVSVSLLYTLKRVFLCCPFIHLGTLSQSTSQPSSQGRTSRSEHLLSVAVVSSGVHGGVGAALNKWEPVMLLIVVRKCR